jgi:hypothetical protein
MQGNGNQLDVSPESDQGFWRRIFDQAIDAWHDPEAVLVAAVVTIMHLESDYLGWIKVVDG